MKDIRPLWPTTGFTPVSPEWIAFGWIPPCGGPIYASGARGG